MIDAQIIRQLSSPHEVQTTVREAKASGDTIGFVPTMGALHEGHLSLVEASIAECDRTVVSIFVNPTQFGPGEDIEHYPRPLEKDIQLLSERGVWVAFVPAVEEIYPAGFDSYIDVGRIAEPFEGSIRTSHFRGVATVVMKLFQLVPADFAYFGRKDYQQSLVIRKLVEDFHLPVEIKVCPIVRESDGLAMSSRNSYLDAGERQQATALWKSLELAEQQHAAGEQNCAVLEQQMREQLASSGIGQIDYIAFLKDGTMTEVETIEGPTTVALAARVGPARLIDNHTIGMP